MDRVPSIVAEVRQIAGTMILDGEAVVLDDQGRSDFGALQRAFGGRGGKGASSEVILYAFDLLYLDGHLSSRPPVSAAWVGAAGGAAGRSPGLCRRRRNGLHGRFRNCAPKADGQNRDFRTGGGHREEAAECDIGSARARRRDRV